MAIYGIAVLAGCYIAGLLIGELLAKILGIEANIGGVGFAMLLLILTNQWMHKRNLISKEMEKGILFWSNIYIPVIVAMASIQNVKAALSNGTIAILAGIVPTAICFMAIPLLSKLNKAESPETNKHP